MAREASLAHRRVELAVGQAAGQRIGANTVMARRLATREPAGGL
jgi:hypothetical protein